MASRTYRGRTTGIIQGITGLKHFYLTAWVVWFLTLWYLSSDTLPKEPTPDFPFKDKVLHWGYFGIGGALLSFYTLAITGKKAFKVGVFLSLLFLGIMVGALDEWHQSWNPNRSGNDLGDLTADTIGTLCGLIIAPKVWRFLLKD